MLRRQHLLSGLTVLVVCLIAFVYNKSHTESVSLAQDGPSHSECLSSVEKMMKALDFSSLREYEDHVLSTGKALPCGLRSHSTAQNITHRVVLSHEHKQTLWSMIFGNFFDNDSDEKKTPDGSQKQIKTISSSLPSGAQRKDHHTIAATRANSSLLEQHSSHLHLGLVPGDSSKKTLIHKTNTKKINAELSRTPPANYAAALSKQADTDHQKVRGEAPASVKIGNADSAATAKHELARLKRVVNESAPHQSRLEIRGTDEPVKSGSDQRTKLVGRTKSEEWLTKLRREAYHLGYALVPQHRDTNVQSADHMPELSIAGSEVQPDSFSPRNIPAVENPAVENKKSESLIEVQKTKVNNGLVSSAELKAQKSQDLDARKKQIERLPIISAPQTHRSFVSQEPARPKASGDENAFESKDQQRLANEARIEAAMHSQLQAEARQAREKLSREGASKAVQVN